MATQRWTGSAPAIAQVNTWTFAGTWLSTETITVTVGSKAFTMVTGSATIATFLATLLADLQALSSTVYPEFAEVTWAVTSPNLTATANTAGKPFTITVSTNSASGTINSSSSSTGTATVASSGPNDWSTAANWSTGSVPISNDTVYVENSAVDILYGLAQSGVTLTALNVAQTFTGKIGLPELNSDGTSYHEYRPTFLAISATSVNIGTGDVQGQGSGRIKLDTGSNACTLICRFMGSQLETDVESLQYKGVHASNVFSLFGGTAAIAGYSSDSATVPVVNAAGSATLRCGPGATLTTVNVAGSASVEINGAATTINATSGSVTVKGTGAVTTITADAASVDYRSSGTITTLTVGNGASFDCSNDSRARTVTNCTVYAGAGINDPAKTVVFSNAITLTRCDVPDCRLVLGKGRTLLPT